MEEVTRFHVNQPSQVRAAIACTRQATPRHRLPKSASTAVAACETPRTVVVIANTVHERQGSTKAAQPHSAETTMHGIASENRGRSSCVFPIMGHDPPRQGCDGPGLWRANDDRRCDPSQKRSFAGADPSTVARLCRYGGD